MERLWSDYVFALLVKTGVLPRVFCLGCFASGVLPRVFCLGRFASGQIPIELDRWSSTDGARPMELELLKTRASLP